MVNTTARIKKIGKHFEILVDLDEALRFKKGEADFVAAESEVIFTDIKKGERASEKDLKEAFGTDDVNEIVQKIVKEGDVLTTQEHRDAEQEKKFKQVVDFLVNNVINPQTNNPITAERIKSALDQVHVNIKNVPIENQITEIVENLRKVIPIRIETKKVKITIPAIHTGKVYGIVNQYKEHENWLSNGDLEVIVNIPAGMIMNFYDKLNSATHGSALTEEVRE
jgi:rRNA metabolism SBDS family protein